MLSLLALATMALATNTPDASLTAQPHNLRRLPGPILSSVDILPLFFGNSSYQDHLVDFYHTVNQSIWWSVLGQYGVQNASLIASARINPQNTTTTLNDVADIQPLLVNLIKSERLQVTPNAYYPLHVAHGVSVTYYNGVACRDFGAYHGTLDLTTLNITGVSYATYAVLPDCGETLHPEDFATFMASHELAEAVLNPLGGLAIDLVVKAKGDPSAVQQAAQYVGWFDVESMDNFHGEAADACEGVKGQTAFGNTTVGDTYYTVAKLWSNADNACVLALGGK